MSKWIVRAFTLLVGLVAFANVASATTWVSYQPDVPQSLLKK